MSIARIVPASVFAILLAGCGGGEESGGDAAPATEAAEPVADAASSGQYFSCFFNDSAEDKKLHFVNDPSPMPAGVDEATLAEGFFAKVSAEHELSGMNGEPVCTIGATAEETRLRSALFTNNSEELGLTTVKVVYP